MCKTVWTLFQSFRWTLVCLMPALALGAESATVRSYNGQFVVTAPDIQYASQIAQMCEHVRKRAQRRLGLKGLWGKALTVHIARRTVEGQDEPETVWDVGIGRGGQALTRTGLWYGQIEDFLRLGVCYGVLWQAAQDSAVTHKGSLRGRPLPFWLYAGLAGLMQPKERLDLYLNTTTAIKDQRSYLLADLFAHTGRFADDEQRAIFHQQAATVVDFLLSVRNGRTRMRQSLENLWRKSTYTLSLRWEYRDLFSTIEPMQAAWQQYVFDRPARMLSEQRLTLVETDAILETLLAVDIPVIAKDTIEQSVVHTDLHGLSKHDNPAVVGRLCKERVEALLQLAPRSAPEFKPAIEGYIKAINAIRAGSNRKFRHEYKRAQRAHKAVRALPYFTHSQEQ